MKSLLRYLFILAGTVVVLLLAFSLAVLLFVDPNDYREDIVEALNEETGREFSLSGELSLGVFPCCSVRTAGISVANPPGWPEGDFARIDSAEVSLQLWPLISRRELRVGQVAISGLMLNLISRRDGSVNWEFATAEEPEESDPDDSDDSGAPGEFAVDADGITVSNAALLYTDEINGDRIELLDFNLETGRIVSGKPVDLSLSVNASGLLPDRSLKLAAATAVLLDTVAQQVELQDLAVRLDDSRITGWLRLTDLNAQRVTFDLKVDQFNADSYMVADEAAAGDAGQSASDIRETPIEVPAEMLRSLNLDGKLAIGELTFEGAQLADVNITVKAEGGRLRLHPLTADLYGGSYAGDVQLDVRGSTPKLSVDEKLSGILVGRLLSDAADMANLSGLGNVGIKATASGDTVGELLDRLQGDAAFDLQEGLYQGVDLWYEIRKARARLKKIESPAVPETPQTELSEFAGTLNFSGGTVNNRDFIAKLPFMRLSGNGSINLLESSLDYDLLARVVETPVFADGDDLDSLKGLVLPIQIKGGIDAPKVSVDIGELAKSAAENKLKERLRKKFGLDEPESDKDGNADATAQENTALEQPASDQTSSDQLSAEDQLKQDAKDKVKQKLRGLFD